MCDPFVNAKFIDLHYHVNPDLFVRRWGIKKTGDMYKKHNGAVCLKSHLCSTVELALLAQESGLPVIGSIVLNKINGGIDYRSVLKYLSINKNSSLPLVVFFPTITGRAHKLRVKRKFRDEYLSTAATAGETLSENSRLKQSATDVLKLALDYPLVLASGHADKSEIYLLAEECYRLGVNRLLITHPTHPMTGMNYEELLKLSENRFLWFEQTALTYLLGYQDDECFDQIINELPNTFYSSDLGQTTLIGLEDWLSQTKIWFAKFKILPNRVEELVKENPLKILRKEQ